MNRYGTVLRCYDNGGRSFDRYTIIPPRWARQYRERAPGIWSAIASSDSPFNPQGFGQHVTAAPGPHLGKRIDWSDLPDDVQRFARQAFPDYAPSDGTIDLWRNPTPGEIRRGYSAIHWRTFPADDVRKLGHMTEWGKPVFKRWIVAADDGLRYYR